MPTMNSLRSRRLPASLSRDTLTMIAKTAVEMFAAGDEPGKGGQDRALTCRRCSEARTKLRRLVAGGLTEMACVLLSGCNAQLESPTPPPPPILTSYPGCETSSRRIMIKRLAVVEDDIAYGNRRGVYLIKDNDTGLEYIGVSGIGISVCGSHMEGKNTKNDER